MFFSMKNKTFTPCLCVFIEKTQIIGFNINSLIKP